MRKPRELLDVHAACSHNRFAASSGSMLCPLQRTLGESYVPHLFFRLQHLTSQVDGLYDIGSKCGFVIMSSPLVLISSLFAVPDGSGISLPGDVEMDQANMEDYTVPVEMVQTPAHVRCRSSC